MRRYESKLGPDGIGPLRRTEIRARGEMRTAWVSGKQDAWVHYSRFGEVWGTRLFQ